MKLEDRLKEKAGKRNPYKVPDRYFDGFKDELMSKLPEYPQKPAVKDVSIWHKIRPYIYMAAMFAGIWCMMKIFHTASTSQPNVQTVAETTATSPNNLFTDQESFDYLATNTTIGDSFELEEEVSELYPSIEEFKNDFYSVEID